MDQVVVVKNIAHGGSEDSLNESAVYYDGQCPICSREINHLKKQSCDLNFKDVHLLESISVTEKEALLKQLHVVTSDGAVLVGFDANIYLWRSSGLVWLPKLLTMPIVNGVARAAYNYWADKRYERKYAAH